MGSGKGKTRRAQSTVSPGGRVTRQGTFKEKQYDWSPEKREVQYRYRNRHWEIRKNVAVDRPFLDDLDDWIAELRAATAGLVDANIDMSMGYEIGRAHV